MKINSKTGLLTPCAQLLSPNRDSRPEGESISLIVIHSISLPPGEYGGDAIERFFTNQLPADEHPYFQTIKQLKVSAHVLIKRDGSLIQFVPFHERAWHAGISAYHERENCNDFSIGIELEGTDTNLFEKRQYKQLAQLITTLQASYPAIKDKNITGHSDIAAGRKTDPGSGFDWQYLQTLLS